MSKNLKIVALGDSLTYGYPFGNELSWVQLCNEALGLDIVNQGQNGNRLRDIHERILPDLVDYHPQVCILLAGTNDIIHEQFNLENMKEYFAKIFEECVRSNIELIIALPPMIKNEEKEKELAKFRRYLKKIAKEENLNIFDFYSALRDKKTKKPVNDLYEDKVHPNADGYTAMSKVAITYFQSFFNQD